MLGPSISGSRRRWLASARRRSRSSRRIELLPARRQRADGRTRPALCAKPPPGTIVESQRPERFAEALRSWRQSGPFAALIIDYGYATASAGDTLQAVRAHVHEHVLTSPGEADISAHVSFYELASVLHAAGLAIDGPVTQAEFLGSLGIIERASRLMHANPARAGEIEAGVARLIAPNGMGTRFKVIGVRSPGLPPLPGFVPAAPSCCAVAALTALNNGRLFADKEQSTRHRSRRLTRLSENRIWLVAPSCSNPSSPPILPAPHIRHGFFTREGGVSDGIYAGLNTGLGSNDDPAKVLENRAAWPSTWAPATAAS